MVSAEKGYRSVRGEPFPSYNKGMFETQMFFWLDDISEYDVVGRIYDTILRRSGVSEDYHDVLDLERRVLLIC